MENSLGNAIYKESIGYKTDEDEAKKWICKQPQKTFKGWDGEYYPYYVIMELEEIK